MTTAIAHPTPPLLALLRRHPVPTFVVLAFAFSWSVWVPLALAGRTVDFGSTATHVPGLFGPALAALLAAALVEGRPGVEKLVISSLTFRGGWRWLAFAVLSPLALFAAAAAVFGAPPLAELGVFAGLPEAGVLPLWVMLFLTAWGEEAGWRGFALPWLQRRHTAFTSTLLVTLAWALWHVPAFAFLASYAGMSAGTAAGFFLGLLGGSFVLTWLYNRTGGSVLPVAVWHASFNLVTATRGARGDRAAAVSVVVMLFGFALAAADLLARRRGRAPVLGQPETH